MKQSNKVKALVKSLTALYASLHHSFNTHQATRLIEWSHELQKCRTVSNEIKGTWLNAANEVAFRLEQGMKL